MGSDNPTGADYQQETETALELDALWIVGFVDGEGCFSVAIHENDGAPHGWQLTPVFQVYQHQTHRVVLESLRRHSAADGSARRVARVRCSPTVCRPAVTCWRR
jgi:hypothetical protein